MSRKNPLLSPEDSDRSLHSRGNRLHFSKQRQDWSRGVRFLTESLRKDPHDINERSVPGSGEQRELYLIAIVDNLLGKCRT